MKRMQEDTGKTDEPVPEATPQGSPLNMKKVQPVGAGGNNERRAMKVIKKTVVAKRF
jgi:hypothetical protein